MPKLTLETSDREKPILLIAGKNPLIKHLVSKFKKDFKIAYVSDDEDVLQDSPSQDFYRIKTSAAYLVKNLEEKIDYGIIFLHKGDDRRFLPHLLDKLTSDHAKTVVIIEAQKLEQFGDVLLEYKRIPNFSFLLIGDLYYEKESLNTGIDIAKIIRGALLSHSITLTGNDLTPIFPIYLQDAVSGISQVLFGPKGEGRFYYLFYTHPETLISAIHILKRVEPDLEIQYKEGNTSVGSRLTHQDIKGVLNEKLLTAPVFLDKHFLGFERSIPLLTNHPAPEEKRAEGKLPKIIKPSKKTAKNFVLYTLSSIFIYAMASLLLLIGGALYFKSAVSEFNRQDYRAASQDIKTTRALLNFVSPSMGLFSQLTRMAGVPEASAFFDNFTTASNLMEIAGNDLTLVEKINNGMTRDQLNRLIADGFYLYFTAEKFRLVFPNQAFNSLLTPELSKTLSLSEIAAKILGFNGERKYLLLFQNNGELRPTGGFIGSIGELTVKDGEIKKLEIRDVYDYDGKLKTHVEPHYIVRRYLQPHLYLRDSNFNPDFQNSASTAALLYNLETGKKVDGIIAINYEAVAQIIKAVGPIKLAAYNKTIDENNAFEFLQETIDKNFFPGSTQKRDVLEALFNQLILKIEGNTNNTMKIARMIPTLMQQKNIIFAFEQPSTQAIFSSEGYSGEYRDTRFAGRETIPDFLAINEANIGVNKANAYLSRTTSYEVNLSEGKILSKITHTIKNDLQKSVNYKAYIRVYVPAGSVITTIKIGGQNQKIVPAVTDFKIYEAKNFKAPDGLEVDSASENGRQVFGFIIDVPKGKKQTVEVAYENGISTSSTPLFSYSLLLIKQPGVATYPFVLNVNYGSNFTPKEVENAILNNGDLKISKNVDTDEEFLIKFIKK